eukprot:6230117-Prymnesium_polylepis.1
MDSCDRESFISTETLGEQRVEAADERTCVFWRLRLLAHEVYPFVASEVIDEYEGVLITTCSGSHKRASDVAMHQLAGASSGARFGAGVTASVRPREA